MPWELERSTRLGRKELGNIASDFGQARRFAEYPDQYCSNNWNHVARPNGNYWTGQERFSVRKQLAWGTLLGLKKVQDIRFAQVRMALNAWRIENGSYPEKLSELVPEYFSVLPVDVINANEFAYSAKGLDAKVGWDLPQPLVQRQQADPDSSNHETGGFPGRSEPQMGMFDQQPTTVENRKEFIKNMNANLKANGMKLIEIEDEPVDAKPDGITTKELKLDLGAPTASDVEQSRKTTLQPPHLPVVSWEQSSTFVDPNKPFLLPWSSANITKRKLLLGSREGPTTQEMCYDFSSNRKRLDIRGSTYDLDSFELKSADRKVESKQQNNSKD